MHFKSAFSQAERSYWICLINKLMFWRERFRGAGEDKIQWNCPPSLVLLHALILQCSWMDLDTHTGPSPLYPVVHSASQIPKPDFLHHKAEVPRRRFWLCIAQATEAEGKDDREVICKEIFADVTEELDELAQGEVFNAISLYSSLIVKSQNTKGRSSFGTFGIRLPSIKFMHCRTAWS